ncbi:hypothetical protein B7Y94_01795 [Candidatus Saccharibacteria bacterium 32-49-12]|nr:MAG: hypothetical protein B7Y94_01795 [Candidatus Saccharibacteria bacterium 32-49-12]
MAARRSLAATVAVGWNENPAPTSRRRRGEPKRLLLADPHANQGIIRQSIGNIQAKLLEMSSNTTGVCEAMRINARAQAIHGQSTALSFEDYTKVASESGLTERSQNRGLKKILSLLDSK